MPASELVTALFTAPRSATLSVQAAKQALLFEEEEDEDDEDDEDDGGAVRSAVQGGLEGKDRDRDRDKDRERGGSGVLLGVVRQLCDRHLCRWFRLSTHDCGQLRMQILMDVY